MPSTLSAYCANTEVVSCYCLVVVSCGAVRVSMFPGCLCGGVSSINPPLVVVGGVAIVGGGACCGGGWHDG